jgi:hypothetical protein
MTRDQKATIEVGVIVLVGMSIATAAVLALDYIVRGLFA